MPAIRTTRNSTAGSGGPAQDPARPSPAAGKESEVSEDATYNSGDFTIIAGPPENRVVFRLPSFFMLAASVVIRDTFAIGTTGGKLELDVPDQASAVKTWLDLVTGKPLPQLASKITGRSRRVLALCRQFDCPSVASIVLAGLEASLDDAGVSAVDILLTCSEYDGSRQFVKCIGARGDKTFAKARMSAEPENLRAIYDGTGRIRDLASWPLQDFCKLPPAYAWALLRSYRLTDDVSQQTAELKSLLDSIENRRNASPAAQPSLDFSAEGNA